MSEAAQPALAYWSQEKEKKMGIQRIIKEMCVGGGGQLCYKAIVII